MNRAFEQVWKSLTIEACAVDIVRSRVVDINSAGAGIYATAATKGVGVSHEDRLTATTAADNDGLQVVNQGFAFVECVGAVATGAEVEVTGVIGKVITIAAGVAVGKCWFGGTDQVITVKLY
jgi:hypothetical protein